MFGQNQQHIAVVRDPPRQLTRQDKTIPRQTTAVAMASRILSSGARALTSGMPAVRMTRNFQTSARRLDAVAASPLPARKPVGAFRGGLFGFFMGSTLAGGGVYYYILQEYKMSNELLTEDIYALQGAVERVSKYLTALEEKVDSLERKKK
ncbi:hypothetical protein QBC33DRAFT_531390 [Phialemonium atrogriseum]|uniref:Uncharacterized protein n=1 Tax=Phialemonium atrogriseum TaxID=1093897 RepID=A0AAJ0C514_9PEZI|nr:uncharacterized protein QBC33DRAFT_531390 [Phialemonium atrogriseum]KAK1769622.1 hypothetical protein QBC33DRAFT_531390 [Phialemonium atrogriseum]